ncbi:MAG: LysR substrate-binding domain-containing protein [Pseudomonadales bacterium]|nr:LysR substrate-binding domain-containing protein [Pseudomonadales bacterium]NRA17963.1 LysR family transcriptional regulator [Oceanospirillaceae bacterium]
MDKLTLMNSFAAVVEQGSYTKAAASLGKTKAIVSKQVSQLEELLQAKLINRTTRSIAITDTGKVIYASARQILDDVGALQLTAQGQKDAISGRLRISAPQSFAEIKLTPLLAKFMLAYPNITVDMQLNDRYVDIVDEGFDLAIRIGEMQDSNLIARKIGAIESVLVASPALLKQYPKIQTPDDIRQLPAIHDSNRRSGAKWRFSLQGLNQTVLPNTRLTVNSAVAAKSAAVAGLGISLLPDFSVQQELQLGSLVRLLSPYTPQQTGIYILYPHRQHLTAKVQALLSFFIDDAVALNCETV